MTNIIPAASARVENVWSRRCFPWEHIVNIIDCQWRQGCRGMRCCCSACHRTTPSCDSHSDSAPPQSQTWTDSCILVPVCAWRTLDEDSELHWTDKWLTSDHRRVGPETKKDFVIYLNPPGDWIISFEKKVLRLYLIATFWEIKSNIISFSFRQKLVFREWLSKNNLSYTLPCPGQRCLQCNIYQMVLEQLLATPSQCCSPVDHSQTPTT